MDRMSSIRFQFPKTGACFRSVGTLFDDSAYRFRVVGICSQNDHCVGEPRLVFHWLSLDPQLIFIRGRQPFGTAMKMPERIEQQFFSNQSGAEKTDIEMQL